MHKKRFPGRKHCQTSAGGKRQSSAQTAVCRMKSEQRTCNRLSSQTQLTMRCCHRLSWCYMPDFGHFSFSKMFHIGICNSRGCRSSRCEVSAKFKMLSLLLVQHPQTSSHLTVDVLKLNRKLCWVCYQQWGVINTK